MLMMSNDRYALVVLHPPTDELLQLLRIESNINHIQQFTI